HLRSLHLESSGARTQSDRRSRAGPARGLASGDARPEVPRHILEGLGGDVDRETARDRVADDRPIRHQDVRDRPRLRVHRDTRFRAELPKPDPGPPGRGPRAPICRRHGVRDARAKGRGEHLPLERTQGANSPGGAPNSFLPQGASACLGRGVEGPRGRVPTYNKASNSSLDSHGKRAVVIHASRGDGSAAGVEPGYFPRKTSETSFRSFFAAGTDALGEVLQLVEIPITVLEV